jgi:hypothetical protein
MARGIFAQFTKIAEITLRYRYVCESCDRITDWCLARFYHKSNRTQNLGFINSEIELIESPERVAKDQAAVNKRLKSAITAFNTAITTRTTEVIFPGDPFLSDAYNDIFAHGDECPFCGERQTWYPAVSDTPSTLKTSRNYAIISAGLGIVAAFLAKDAFPYYWTIPIGTMLLGGGIGWLLADEAIKKKQKFFDSHPKHNNPEIEWNYVPENEESTAAESLDKDALTDIPAVAESLAVEYLTETPAIPLTDTLTPALSTEVRIPTTPQSIIAETITREPEPTPLTTNLEPAIITVKTNKTDIYKQLKGKEHINILTIHQVTDGNITFEDFNGITLQERLKSPLSAHDFEDYFTQICDALEFLHSQKKPISYNNLTADNIVIGDDNLLKLFNFNKADNGTPISQDIEAVAKLMLSVNEKYVKRYTSITKPCFNGKFTSFDEINMAISKNVRNRLGIRYSLLAAGLMMLFMFRRVGSRLVPMFEQLFHEVWKMIFGT